MRRKALLPSLLVGVFALDRLAKLWAGSALSSRVAQQVIPHLLELRYSENRGMALGFLSGNAVASLLLPMLAMGIWFFVFHKYQSTTFTTVASGLLLGGFVGNFSDRLFLGFVVDMLYFPFLPWFICNVADIAICTGVGMLVVSLLFRPQDWREKHAKDDGAGAV